MKLEKAIAKVLDEKKITDFVEFRKQVEKYSKSEFDPFDFEIEFIEFLEDNIYPDIAFNWDKQALVSRKKLFADTSFKIQITPDEYRHRQLIIGHRLIPFVNPEIPCMDLRFSDDENNTIIQTKAWKGLEEVDIYFSLMPFYGLQNYDLNLQKNKIEVVTLDLSDWMERTGFENGDQILVSPIDYNNNEFLLERLSRDEQTARKLVTRNIDEALESAITEVLTETNKPIPVDLCLFWAYAIGDEKLLEHPGTAIGPLISSGENIRLFNNGAFPFLHFHNYFDSIWEQALDGDFLPDMDEIGKAKDLNGIFNELNNSFTEEFVASKFILQIHEQENIDKKEVFSLLFRTDLMPFFTDEQEKNFKRAFDTLAEKINKEWQKKRLPLPIRSLLSKTVAFKIDFINFLREIDDKLVDPESFDFEELFLLQPVDNLLDHLMFIILDEKEGLSADDAKLFKEKLVMSMEHFYAFKQQILDKL